MPVFGLWSWISESLADFGCDCNAIWKKCINTSNLQPKNLTTERDYLIIVNMVFFESTCLLSPEPKQVLCFERGGRMLPSVVRGKLVKSYILSSFSLLVSKTRLYTVFFCGLCMLNYIVRLLLHILGNFIVMAYTSIALSYFLTVTFCHIMFESDTKT